MTRRGDGDSREVTCLPIPLLLSSRTPVRDLPEVLPFRFSKTGDKGTTNCPPGRACPVLVTGGAVAERLRGRSFCFLLFCRVKGEAENPFEIETHTDPSLPPRYPHPVPNGADCLLPI